MTIRTDLRQLRQVWPSQDRPLTEQEESWYLSLSEPATIPVIWRCADELAQREYLAETGRRAFHSDPIYGVCVHGLGDGWHPHTTVEERAGRSRAQLDRLDQLRRDRGDDAGLTAWLETADAAGWPPLYAGEHGVMDRARFDAALQRERDRLDSHRRASSLVAERWRRDHPAWREGLDPAAAAALDRQLEAENADLWRPLWEALRS